MKKFVRVIALVCAILAVMSMCGCNRINLTENECKEVAIRVKNILTDQYTLDGSDQTCEFTVGCDSKANLDIICKFTWLNSQGKWESQYITPSATRTAQSMIHTIPKFIQLKADKLGYPISSISITVVDCYGIVLAR